VELVALMLPPLRRRRFEAPLFTRPDYLREVGGTVLALEEAGAISDGRTVPEFSRLPVKVAFLAVVFLSHAFTSAEITSSVNAELKERKDRRRGVRQAFGQLTRFSNLGGLIVAPDLECATRRARGSRI
jgi:hypothetical protein